jgi:DNA mismatch repair protein MutL
MSDIIQLLPDHLANQIAAGEVIQRPASAVKELVENAVDAGATSIHLILKDAGKELIQVIDNGKGMSPMDARMSFERHATSKIKKIEDLFEVRTKGFRGEALASIAAVAQVVLKTKRAEDSLGTQIEIESSNVTAQEPIGFTEGTSIAIKNLFYNVPARRHFLKSNTTELKHVLDEFIRIAMAHPDIAFRFTHNNVEQYNLSSGNLKQRILAILGNNIDKHLIPVEEHTDIINITGYIGKPEAAARTRGNQFFFINNRFIKSPYLNHAVTAAYEGLIPKEAFPTYFLFLEIDPRKVDVNVHPTKQEVKFDDDKTMYAYLHAALKYALSKFNVAPSIDFSLDADIQNLTAVKMPFSAPQRSQVSSSNLFEQFSSPGKAHFIERQQDRSQWRQQQETFFPEMPSMGLSSGLSSITPTDDFSQPVVQKTIVEEEERFDHIASSKTFVQWQEYIITTMKSGVLVMNHKRALERIIYERLSERMLNKVPISQQLLFPVEVSFTPQDAILLQDILADLYLLGYNIIPSSAPYTFSITGVPTEVAGGQEQQVLESILDQMKHESDQLADKGRLVLLRTMAKRMAVVKSLNHDEMQALVDELFACEQPQYAPDGKLIFRILERNQMLSLL